MGKESASIYQSDCNYSNTKKTKDTKSRALQGLRFWAITLVVASHCGLLAQGGVGNDVFFALSGFLAGMPFKEDGEYAFFYIKKYGEYYLKRFFRIIPVYWTGLWFATFLLMKFSIKDITSFNSLILNMFFIKSAGHLWFLQQEVLFYIIVPVIMTVLALLKKVVRKYTDITGIIDFIIFAVLILASMLSNRYLTPELFYLNGNSKQLGFRVGCLLCGMAFAYLYKELKACDFWFLKSRVLYLLSDICVFVFLLFTIITAEPILSRINEKYTGYYIGWQKSTLLVYVSSILIVVLLFTANAVGNRFLGNPVFVFWEM